MNSRTTTVEPVPVRGGPVPDQIARWAAVAPHARAVVDGDHALTYAELHRRAGGLARRLRALGAGPDTVVAVYLERGVDLVVATTAVLAAGAAYLALDVHQPAAWTGTILADCAAGLVITRPDLWRDAGVGGPRAVDVRQPPDDAGWRPPAPHDLAYVTYTSGSSGAPKGVLIEHRGLGNLVSWYRRQYRIGPDDRMTQLARPSFDAFALEVWPCLASGATLRIVPGEVLQTPPGLADWLRATGTTVCFVPTPLAEELIDLPWPGGGDNAGRLRAMLVGGDRLTRHPPAGLPFRLYNNYGPTECSVVAASGEVAGGGPREEPPAIGTPIPGVTAHVLDGDLGRVPDGQPGELYLGGIGLARGYLGGPSGAFLDTPDGRVYATGDIVRRTPDGNLHFLGRRDDQVKIRGFRVEPAQVEAALRRHPAVRSAAVVGRRQPSGVDTRLIGFVVPAAEPVGGAELRSYLMGELPDYMVPDAVCVVDAFPTTAHGKIDRKALATAAPAGEPEPAADPVPDEVAEALAAAWSEVLDRPVVHPGEQFFDVGGDSLRVFRLMSAARRRGITVRPEDVYEYPVLRDLAAVVRRNDQREEGAQQP